MKPERWQAIETIFHGALELPAAERAGFISQACQHDQTFLAEVERLLASYENADGFMDSPVVEELGLTRPRVMLKPGQHLGHYEITEPLGQGGMGEVYLAVDTRLKRRVALKILSAQLMHDPQFVERFAHEARAASALNHPNIITVHDIGHQSGVHFMATEYVEGETMRARLARAPLPLAETLAIATQIAEALNAAHAAGVIHRDIKPENVMIRPDGLVKVLDFGLAKPITEKGSDTLDVAVQQGDGMYAKTDPRVLLGTLRYLAPEQIRHEKIDHRADIFSFGVMLYEMLARRQPFNGANAPEILQAIQRCAPAPLPAGVPSSLTALVSRALANKKDQRFQTAAELKSELARTMQTAQPGAFARWWKQAAATAVLLLLLLSGFWYWQIWRNTPTLASKFNAPARKMTDTPGQELFPNLSPDGQSLVFASLQSGNWDIYHQPIGERTATNLTANSPNAEIQPAISPDGQKIAFRSWNYGVGIFVMNIDGSQIKRLSEFGFNPCWSPDGSEVAFAEDIVWDFEGRNLHSRLWAVNVLTLAKRLITESDAVQPNWSPHGQRLAYWGGQKGGHRDIWTVPAQGGTAVPVTDDAYADWNPVWSPDGEHLYFLSNRGGEMNLWRVAINEQTGALRGAPESVNLPSNNCQYVSFARNGSAVVYAQVNRSENIWQIGFDPVSGHVAGTATQLTQGLKRYAHFGLAPDENSFVYLARGEPQQDLFIANLDGSMLRRLTDDLAQDLLPRWSPDGQRVAFLSDRSGKYEIWLVRADGSNLRQLTGLSGEGQEAIAPIWSPDGQELFYQNRGGELYSFDLAQTTLNAIPKRLPGAPPSGFYPWQWSPDGNFLAGYLTPTPQQQRRAIVVYSRAQERYAELPGQGNDPIWLNDSQRLLYRYGSKLFLLERNDALAHAPQLVYELKASNQIGNMALSKDNRRLYYSEVSSDADLWWLPLK